MITGLSNNVGSSKAKNWEIPLKSISFIEDLSSCRITYLRRAEVKFNKRNINAVVKMLKDTEHCTGRKHLMAEICILKELDHVNVISMIGCCTIEGLPLHSELITYGKQIACGLAFLEEKECVVRALSATNIQIGDDKVCKIAELGYSTSVMTSDEFESIESNRLPLRWMALESLLDCFYTTKSDTWSYGIVLWEIFNFGKKRVKCHTHRMKDNDIVHEIQDGYRMQKPRHCHVKIYTLMYQCWEQDPSSRPSYAQIINTLENVSGSNSDNDEEEDPVYVNIVGNSLQNIC
ncbi:tyrosine kinase receptor Cad96Ca-like [Saccoglossus kowalevskii]